MTEAAVDELGPVDHLVVDFPEGESSFTGEMAKMRSPDRLAGVCEAGGA